MRSHIYVILWRLTGLIAIGLFIATFILAYQARSQPENGLNVTLTSPNPTVYLREEPSGISKIVTILERGSTVHVIDAVIDQDVRWMKVESGRFTGWIPEANLVFDNE